MMSKIKNYVLGLTAISFIAILFTGSSSVAIAATSPYSGVYSGTTSDCGAGAGGFSIIVKANGKANVLYQDGDGHFVKEGMTVAGDGSFSGKGTIQDDFFSWTIDFTGTLTATGVTGDYLNTFPNATTCAGTLSGSKVPDTGTMATAGGYYTGTLTGTASFEGVSVGTLSGPVFVIAAADGSSRIVKLVKFRNLSGVVDDSWTTGGAFIIDSTGAFSFTDTYNFAPDDFGSETTSGTVDKINFTISGDYLGVFTEPDGTFTETETFSLTRSFLLPPPPPVTPVNFDLQGVMAGSLICDNGTGKITKEKFKDTATFSMDLSAFPLVSTDIQFLSFIDPFAMSGMALFKNPKGGVIQLFGTDSGSRKLAISGSFKLDKKTLEWVSLKGRFQYQDEGDPVCTLAGKFKAQ